MPINEEMDRRNLEGGQVLLQVLRYSSGFYPKDSLIIPPGTHPHVPLIIEDGIARFCVYLPDGQRLIADFAFAGDIIAIPRSSYSSVEAVTTTWCREWSDDEASDERGVQPLAVATTRLLSALAIRSRRHAHARLAAFLTDLMDRGLGETFALPISHADIADYLGITVHTASRILSDFRRMGLIKKAVDRVITCDRAALQIVADQDRQFHSMPGLGACFEGAR